MLWEYVLSDEKQARFQGDRQPWLLADAVFETTHRLFDGVGMRFTLDLTSRSIQTTITRMRTTLDLPEDLLVEAMRVTGFKSKTDTIILSLKEFIRRHRIEELKSMIGNVQLEIDVSKSRRRPTRRR
ncbi:MAG: type II toxin-antitoxin system VapB family antitoxin [Planctomycetota bacterium]